MVVFNVIDRRTDQSIDNQNLELVLSDNGFELFCNGVLAVDAERIKETLALWVRKNVMEKMQENDSIIKYRVTKYG